MAVGFDKNIIAKNFSRGAKNYDQLATPQLAAAKNLVNLASPFFKDDCQILDLGSGTSFIGKELFASHKEIARNSRLFEVDMSPQMLNSWTNRPANVFALQGDMENLSFAPDSFDIIFSSFALHWLSDFDKCFLQLPSILKKNGCIAFCLPTHGSLLELSSAGIFQFNEFPKNSAIQDSLKRQGLREKKFICEKVKQKFLDGYEALKFIKKIGGNYTSSKKILTKSRLAEFNSFCLKNFSSDNKSFELSWNVSYFVYTND